MIKLILFLSLIALSICALLNHNEVLSTDSAILSVINRKVKRDADDDFLSNINATVISKDINIKLSLRKIAEKIDVKLFRIRRSNLDNEDSTGKEINWALFHDINGKAAVLLSRNANGEEMAEGAIHHDGYEYLIQPDEENSKHVLHKVHKLPIEKKVLKKRESSKKYEVELHMLFDQSFYEKFKLSTKPGESTEERLKQYYGLLIADIDFRYKYFRDRGLDLNVIMGGMSYLTKDDELPFNTTYLRYEDGLYKSTSIWFLWVFSLWVEENYRQPAFDNIQLHTRNILYGAKGVAWYDEVCQRKSQGIVHDIGSLDTGAISAHELGHNLGIRHDNGSCLNDYIMSPYVLKPILLKKPRNYWMFSNCSFNNVLKYINSLDEKSQNHCMLTRRVNHQLSKYNESYVGLSRTYDEQCEIVYGKGSTLCVILQLKYSREKICSGMFCFNPKDKKCKVITPLTGTPCGTYKVCKNGYCVSDAKGKKLSEYPDSCPFGNAREKFIGVGKNMTCDEAVQVSPAYCYDYSKYCCLTCPQHQSTNAKCLYGDHILRYPIDVPGYIFHDCKSAVMKFSGVCYKYKSKCCSSCIAYDTGPCGSGDSPGNVVTQGKKTVTCSEGITKANMCYKYEKHCCLTCRKFKNNKIKHPCRYGDHPLNSPIVVPGYTFRDCKTAFKRFPGICYRYYFTCCETCKHYKPDHAKFCASGNNPGNVVKLDNGKKGTCDQTISERTANLCYDYKDTCCHTCKKFINAKAKGCEYGDRRRKFQKRVNGKLTLQSCKEAIKENLAGDCKDSFTRFLCCESCPKYEKKNRATCRYGDMSGMIMTHDEKYETCSRYIKRHNSGVCKIGTIRNVCCHTCSKFKTDIPNCEYGDDYRPIWTLNNIDLYCYQITKVFKSICYSREKRCCLTCKNFRDTGIPNCKYGDYFGNRVDVNGQKRTCSEAISSRTKFLCYDAEFHCCETCHRFKTGIKECDYGDHAMKNEVKTCSELITKDTSHLCYKWHRTCCETCQKYLINDPKMSSCKYGDQGKITVNGVSQFCYQAITKQTKELCYRHGYTCCKTCSPFETTIPRCKYGDRNDMVRIWSGGKLVKTTCAALLVGSNKRKNCNKVYYKQRCCKSCKDF